MHMSIFALFLSFLSALKHLFFRNLFPSYILIKYESSLIISRTYYDRFFTFFSLLFFFSFVSSLFLFARLLQSFFLLLVFRSHFRRSVLVLLFHLPLILLITFLTPGSVTRNLKIVYVYWCCDYDCTHILELFSHIFYLHFLVVCMAWHDALIVRVLMYLFVWRAESLCCRHAAALTHKKKLYYA